jgi:hypothetical protein
MMPLLGSIPSHEICEAYQTEKAQPAPVEIPIIGSVHSGGAAFRTGAPVV